MIRAVLQRPGRLRMRLTVVAAASALFALIVLAALVLPSLQRNLEQSRVDSLRASVLASDPSQYLNTFLGTPSTETMQAYAGTLGAGRVAVFERNGVFLETVADSAPRSQLAGARRLVEETASLRRDLSAVQRLPEGRTAVLTVYISTSQGTEGVLLVEAPLRDVQEQVSAVERRLVVGGILAFVVALIAGALAAEPLARRLARLRAAADRIAHGSFSEPIVDNSHDEIGELARSLEEMRIRLEALERSRSAFIANASHELRTPLTALGGYLELLTEGGLTDAERGEFLETMGEQVQRLTKLATDLLDLSRLDAGGITVGKDELDLGTLAADCAREMQPLANRRGSQVLVVEGPDPALARGDEGRVLQVLRVLVDNALRHTPAGSTVTLRTETTPWGASIIVSDNGPGIPPELQERVFERFYRGPGAAARGSGLGLAIARELAEIMEGRLLVASGPEGTRFALELPGGVEEPVAAYTGSS
jgi:two-component system, OmpR family, sensor kinase